MGVGWALLVSGLKRHVGARYGGAVGRTLAVLSADHFLVNVTDLMESSSST